MNPINGNNNLHRTFAGRLFSILLAISLAAGAFIGPLAEPVTAAQETSTSFYREQRSPEVLHQASITYTTLKPPAYKSKPAVVLNSNKPRFTSTQLKVRKEYEKYSSLDKLGRAQTAIACLGKKTLPTAPRGSIGMVKPAGFKTTKYDFIDGKYLYNRCHLIAYELSAENANKKNLTTGTRYLNIKGMLPYENKVATFIKKTGKHVLYRTTPIYNGSELLPRGVTIEARSLEDNGKGICFYVYCYNVQPGVKINYKDGSSTATGNVPATTKAGWKKVNGKYYYYKSDGKTIVKSSWLKLDGKVYYVNSTGARVTGWQTISGKKYWFSSAGVMATGWKTISNNKYWFDTKGAMATGWKTISSKKYWFSSSGVMATGTRTIGGKKYTFDSNGALKSNTGSGSHVNASYIGNKNTKKFHKAGCSSIDSMSESNKVGFDSRSAAISAGYEPCKRCNP